MKCSCVGIEVLNSIFPRKYYAYLLLIINEKLESGKMNKDLEWKAEPHMMMKVKEIILFKNLSILYSSGIDRIR